LLPIYFMKPFLLGLLLVLATTTASATIWTDRDTAGETRVHLYFFWSAGCPHCLEAKPFVDDLPGRHPWLVLHSHEVGGSAVNAALYQAMANEIGQRAESVPGFLFCGQLWTGYRSATTTGAALEQALESCRRQGAAQASRVSAAPAIELPLLGRLDTEVASLPLLTVVLAGLDAFNPCAFFVLLFLLSLLVHEPSRGRMALVGTVFVFFSGLAYFVFMAAWLNIFLLLGELRLATLAAGAVALAVAAANIKDFFLPGRGPSFSIPDGAKPRLYQRMRSLLAVQGTLPLLAGAALLAVVANTYELLCTAGFPMVYTRALTLHPLSPAGYYAYLVFYNLVYVIPLVLIVAAFVLARKSRKLGEEEGRRLKLLSGLMMLGLGLLLLLAPQWLSSPATAAGLVGVAVGITALLGRRRNQAKKETR
jgi:hypothetical protein